MRKHKPGHGASGVTCARGRSSVGKRSASQSCHGRVRPLPVGGRARARPAGGVPRAFSANVETAASLLTCSQVSGVCVGSRAGPARGRLGPRFRLGQGGDAGRRPGLGSPQSQAVGGSGADGCRGRGLGSGRQTVSLNPAVPLAGCVYPTNGSKWVEPSLT